MSKKLISGILGLSLPLLTFAGEMAEAPVTPYILPLSIGAYGGYGAIDGAYHQDGDFAQGRFTLGLHRAERNLFTFGVSYSLGVEVGIQSGNTMRLEDRGPLFTEYTGGLPVQIDLKPFIDVLATVKVHFNPQIPVALLLKGGAAFRTMTFEDRTSERDTLNLANGEFQVGLGYDVTNTLMLNLFYQGIYSSDEANVQLVHHCIGCSKDVGIRNIPTQQAGFLGVQYTFN